MKASSIPETATRRLRQINWYCLTDGIRLYQLSMVSLSWSGCAVLELHILVKWKRNIEITRTQKGRDVGLCMKRFLIAVDTLPVSTASCERGFSSMNAHCTPLRSTLTASHLASFMFLSIEGQQITCLNQADTPSCGFLGVAMVPQTWGNVSSRRQLLFSLAY